MKSVRLIVSILFASCALLSAAYAQAATETAPSASPSAPVTRGEFQQMVKDAIMNEPEIVMHAVRKLREKQEEESKRATAEAFRRNKAALQNDTVSPSIGDPKTADVTVIEFFDYHCGYCKKLLPVIGKLLEEDKKVRVIFREYPILSEDSVAASRAALAVNKLDPGKYFEYHTALMNHSGRYDEATLLDLGKKMGIDPDRLRAEMNKQAITDILEQNRKVGEELGVRGTPAIFVGEKMLPGAIPYGTLKRVVDEVRTGVPSDKAAKPSDE